MILLAKLLVRSTNIMVINLIQQIVISLIILMHEINNAITFAVTLIYEIIKMVYNIFEYIVFIKNVITTHIHTPHTHTFSHTHTLLYYSGTVNIGMSLHPDLGGQLLPVKYRTTFNRGRASYFLGDFL